MQRLGRAERLSGDALARLAEVGDLGLARCAGGRPVGVAWRGHPAPPRSCPRTTRVTSSECGADRGAGDVAGAGRGPGRTTTPRRGRLRPSGWRRWPGGRRSPTPSPFSTASFWVQQRVAAERSPTGGSRRSARSSRRASHPSSEAARASSSRCSSTSTPTGRPAAIATSPTRPLAEQLNVQEPESPAEQRPAGVLDQRHRGAGEGRAVSPSTWRSAAAEQDPPTADGSAPRPRAAARSAE